VILLCIVAFAAPELPNPRTAGAWVSDTAEVIDASEEAALNRRLEALHAATDAEVVVVTVQSTAPDTPREFTTALFERWGVGDREANNGLVVLLSMDDRRVEMEVGYGIEGVLTDAWLGRVREQQMVPRFKQGQFGAGLVDGMKRIDERIRDNAEEVRLGTGGEVSGPPREAELAAGVTALSAGLFCVALGIAGALIAGLVLGIRAYRRRQRTCPDCDLYMPLLSEAEDDAHLSAGQVREEQLGSVDWRVHQCPQCANTRTFASASWFSGYSRCPSCKNKTRSTKSRTLRHATQYRGGLVEITESCGFCSHSRTYQRSTAPLPRVVVSSGRGGGSGGFGGSGGGGFGGGSGGGGSFGGGRSGGAGGGSSW